MTKLTIPLILTLFLACGCFKKPEAKKEAPPVPVEVTEVVRQNVPVEVPAVGNVEPLATVELKPKVGGEVVDVFFDEGAIVEKDKVLFQIDPRPFEVALKRAEANAETAKVQAKNAQDQVDRYTTLIKRGAASEEQFSQLQSAADSQKAQQMAREADVAEAELSKEWSSVKAPISGRTGAVLIKKGNIVQANTQIMTVINQIQPIYVAFSVPENALSEVRSRPDFQSLSVSATSADTGELLDTGKLAFIDNTVDRTSGMVLMKATFPNAEQRLWPGQFVDVALKLDEQKDAMVVPSTAIMERPDKAQVFVVEGDKAVLREVKVSRTFGTLSVIESGLQPGEKVVISGQLRVSPNGKVEVKKMAEPVGLAKEAISKS